MFLSNAVEGIAEYLLAMKLMAMRIDAGQGAKDRTDMIHLMAIVGLTTKDETLAFVTGFYPQARLSAKAAFGLDELFQSGDIPGEASDDAVAPAYLGRGVAPRERG